MLQSNSLFNHTSLRHDYTWELHTFSSIFCLSLFDVLTWLRYLFFNSVKLFIRWYFAPPTILTSSRESLSSVIIFLYFRLSQMWTPGGDLHHLLEPHSHTKNTLHCSTTVAYRESLFLSNHCSVSFQFCSFKFAASKCCLARLMPRRTMKLPVFCSLITSKFNYHW